ncbi:Putative small subunit of thiolase DitF [Paraburkholderia unamae]|uniref:Zn-ribbon domain-containing OB-fold protein n=1 Tax=Paraburkholderia unamae TaxID=219649 RepID=UPI000DC2A130|nr:Zn-ribbon domain-containing OB-fold protein [Paraburkholderia unamae]RAR56415.1 hypothetical protein C7401_11964 [Paraburkholderia unamae]CAG9266077.1 Putative small subunit of thiolase DitF [Paraburkholderia unamae]
MAYLPAGMPTPQPTRDDAPFWDACKRGALTIRHCDACGRFSHPPMPACPHCASTQLGWQEVSGNGTVYTYTVSHHPTHSALKGHGAYNVAVVLLDDADDVRLVTNIVDVAPQDLRIGLPVRVVWETVDDGCVVPRFRRRDDVPSAQPRGVQS